MKNRIIAISLLLISFNVSAQLSGTKTIDKNGSGANNYTSFTAAISALNTQGVGGSGVTFNVSAGQFFVEDTLVLTATGTSAMPVVFQKSGTGANPVIYSTKKGIRHNTTTNESQYPINDAFIKIVGGDYITFNGIDLRDTNTFNITATAHNSNMEYGFYLVRNSATDGCKNITIKNCSISFASDTGGNYLESSVGIFQSNHDINGNILTLTSVDGRSENILYDNISFEKMVSAIRMTGYNDPATSRSLHDQNNRITKCTFERLLTAHPNATGTGYQGVYTLFQNNLEIDNNVFRGMEKAYYSNSRTSVTVLMISHAINANSNIHHNTFKLWPKVLDSNLYSLVNGIYVISGNSGTDNNIIIANNIFDSCKYVTNNGSLYLLVSDASANQIQFNDNEVKNSAGRIGVFRTYTTIKNLKAYNNRFYNHEGGSFDGIVVNVTKAEVYNNIIRNQNVLNYCTGLSINAADTARIYKNQIYGLTANHTSGGVKAIECNGGSNGRTFLYNNMISDLNTPNVISNYFPLAAISTGTSGILYVYHNTVFLNAQFSSASNSSSACLHKSSWSAKLYMYNNVFVNLSTGGTNRHYVHARNGQTYTTQTDYLGGDNNLFYAGVPSPNNGIWTMNAFIAEKLEDWVGIHGINSKDANSISVMPPFKNITTKPYDLHIDNTNATELESYGYTGPEISITEDFDGQVRPGPAGSVNGGGTKPDLGFDEFDGKLTPAMQLQPVTISQVSTNTFAGDTAQEILKINLPVTGFSNTLKIDSLVFSATGTTNTAFINQNRAILYSGRANDPFIKAKPADTATLVNGKFTFDVPIKLATGANIFWLVYYIDATATTGARFDGTLDKVTLNGTSYTSFSGNPAGYREIVTTPMAGAYTVGRQVSTNSFLTLTEAFHNLRKRGVSAPVQIVLNDTVYSAYEIFPLQLDSVAGTSDLKRVTIYPASGNDNARILSPGNVTMILSNTDYITINGAAGNTGNNRNLTLNIATSNGNGVTIWMRALGIERGCKRDSIKNCNLITTPTTSSAEWGVLMTGSTSPTDFRFGLGNEYGAGNDSNVIINNSIQQTFYGIFASANNMSPGVMKGNMVIGNEIGDAAKEEGYYAGIFMYNQVGTKILNNKITNFKGYSGILLNNSDSCEISGNNISDVGSTGIWLGSYENYDNPMWSDGGWVRNTTISNNRLHDIHPNGDVHPAGGYAYPILMTAEGDGMRTKNKIINNFISSYKPFGMPSGNGYGDGGWAIGISQGDSDLIAHNTIRTAYNLDTIPGDGPITLPSGGILIAKTLRDGIMAIRNLRILNNIIDVNFSGSNPLLKNPAIRLEDDVPGNTVIDYNNYVTYGNSFVVNSYKGNDYKTVAQIRTQGFDAHSFSAPVQYVSISDLHLTGISKGNPDLRVNYFPEVPTDIDGINRFMKAAYVGADEDAAEIKQSVQANKDTTVCIGDTAKLSSIVKGQRSALTYRWSPAAGLSDTTIPAPKARPAASTSYIVKITDTYNDSYYDTVVVNIAPLPSTQTTGDTFMCGSRPATLTSVASGIASFKWSNGSTSNMATFSKTGKHSITLVSTIGCKSSREFSITSQPLPNATFNYQLIEGSTYKFLATNNGTNIGYTWDISGAASSQKTPTHTFTTKGLHTIRLIVMDSTTGCTDTSVRTFNIQELDITSLNRNTVTAYPNPHSGKVNLQFNTAMANVQIRITDITGKVLGNLTLENVKGNIELSRYFNLESMPSLAIVNIEADEYKGVIKLVKQ